MSYPIQLRHQNITNEQLARIDNLVPPDDQRLHKTTTVEVLTFVTQFEWETTNREVDMKKKIAAKFRSYEDAEEYAQKLVMRAPYYFKVVIRA